MGRAKKPFYGWVIVGSSMLLLALGLGMYTSTNSVFVKPVCAALGLARGQFTLYRTIVTLLGAATMPLYGGLIRRMGVKKTLVLGAIALGLVNLAYSFATQLWHFYLVAAVNGIFLNGVNFMIVGVLVSAWFDGKKGFATGLAYSGSGIGGAVMIPVVGWLIEQTSWQWAYRFMGLFGVAVMLPVIFLFIKNSPADMGLAPLPRAGAGDTGRLAEVPGATLAQAIRTGKFWLVLAALFLIGAFAGATNTHTAPYLSDLGYSTAAVSSAVSLMMVFLTVGKIALGAVYDRFGTLAGGLVVSVFSLVFPVFALLAAYPGMPWVYAVCVGVASCGFSVPASVLIVRYFGEKEFAVILSLFTMATTAASSASVPAMGAIHDATGSYRLAWLIFMGCSAVITACLVGADLLHRRDVARAAVI